VLKLFASYLEGVNPNEKFHIFTGSGGNGKSKLIELFRMAFGEYCLIFPIELLTQKRGKAGTASPDLARGKGCRFGTFQEPGPDEHIQVGLMKEMSGGDAITAREMYKAPVEFKPRWKLLLTCNNLPNIPSNDDGTWRRLRVVEFKSKFVDAHELESDNPYCFLKDYDLSIKLRNWKEAFMFLLIKYYKKYRKEGIKEPEEVLKYTRQYQEKCNVYMEYINEYLEMDNDPEYKGVKHTDVYKEFKVWFRNQYENAKCPVVKEFKEYLDSKGKSLFNKKGLMKVKIKPYIPEGQEEN
jgi:P4 family phage/plasmid primase-like protien